MLQKSSNDEPGSRLPLTELNAVPIAERVAAWAFVSQCFVPQYHDYDLENVRAVRLILRIEPSASFALWIVSPSVLFARSWAWKIWHYENGGETRTIGWHEPPFLYAG